MTPTVSIVIPTYNREVLIGETLDSLMRQSYPHWQCLIVDDHSTDATAQVCADYVARDARFQYGLNARSKGAQGARNTGTDQAQGDYLIFLDSDDLLGDDCLERRLAVVQAQPDYDFYCFPTAIFKEKPGDTNLQWNYLTTERSDVSRFINIDTPWHTSGVLWKKETLQLLDGWDEKVVAYQDWDIHLRAVLNKNLTYLKTDYGVDTYYRIDDSSTTISKSYKSEKNIRSTVYLIEKFFPLLQFKEGLKGDRLAFASFIYSVASQYYKYVDKEEGLTLLHTYLLKLGYPSSFIKSWSFYLAFRRNYVYHKVFRKLSDVIPYLYRNQSLMSAKSTCKQALVGRS